MLGPKLYTKPRNMSLCLRKGSINNTPHSPPQTIRVYTHDEVQWGAMLTPIAEVNPESPIFQITRLLKSPPIEPAV